MFTAQKTTTVYYSTDHFSFAYGETIDHERMIPFNDHYIVCAFFNHDHSFFKAHVHKRINAFTVTAVYNADEEQIKLTESQQKEVCSMVEKLHEQVCASRVM